MPSVLARLLRALTTQHLEYNATIDEIFALFVEQGLPGTAGGDTVPHEAAAAMLQHLVPDATDAEAAAVAALADLPGRGAVAVGDLLDVISTARAVRPPPSFIVISCTCRRKCGGDRCGVRSSTQGFGRLNACLNAACELIKVVVINEGAVKAVRGQWWHTSLASLSNSLFLCSHPEQIHTPASPLPRRFCCLAGRARPRCRRR